MAEKIILSKYNEELELSEQFDDSEELGARVGAHAVCEGVLSLKQVSTTHNVILCDACGLRVPIPNKVKTYGDLREYLARKKTRRPALDREMV